MGVWSDASHWSTDPVVPHNSDEKFEVSVAQGRVSVDRDVEVDRLDVARTQHDVGEVFVDRNMLSVSTALIGGDGSGTLRVESQGRMAVRDDLLVGSFGGMGLLEVRTGGQITGGCACLGGVKTEPRFGIPALIGEGTGTATIHGSGSMWTPDYISVGRGGHGIFTISGGARVETRGAMIGSRSPGFFTDAGTGVLLVEGEDSALMITGTPSPFDDHLLIGSTFDTNSGRRYNPGTATIRDGGHVEVAGTFSVARQAGHLTVDNATIKAGVIQIGGTLEGRGMLEVSRLENNGLILPGLSTGPIEINGHYIQQDGGRLSIEIGGTEDYGRLLINGTATLGGTLDFRLLEDASGNILRPEDGTPFRIVHTTEGIEGRFEHVVLDSPGILADLDVSYDNGNATVTVLTTTLLGDFDRDDRWTVHDIDLLSAMVVAGTHGLPFDLTADQLVNSDDVAKFLTYARSLPGDVDLDGTVGFSDFAILAEHFGQNGLWSKGDFDIDGSVQFPDFVILSENFGLAAPSFSSAVVPESGSLVLLLTGLLLMRVARGRVVALRRRQVTRSHRTHWS